jgi:hypothetical protein
LIISAKGLKYSCRCFFLESVIGAVYVICGNVEFFGHTEKCPTYRGIDIEPGLNLLKQEYDKGKIIRLDEQTHNRLVEFAKPDEYIVDVINRLLDIADNAVAAKVGEKTGVS